MASGGSRAQLVCAIGSEQTGEGLLVSFIGMGGIRCIGKIYVGLILLDDRLIDEGVWPRFAENRHVE